MRTGTHIRDEALVDFADERLDPVASDRVTAHLVSGCEACASRLRDLRLQFAAMRVYRAPAVPDPLRQELLCVFDRLTPPPTLLERLVAVLKFDSRMQPAFAGVREGEAATGALQMLYETGGISVELWCEREAGIWQITGQALAETSSEAHWRVAAKGEAGEAEVDADEMGMFDLHGLRPGTYDLVLRGPQQEVVLPGIELRSA